MTGSGEQFLEELRRLVSAGFSLVLVVTHEERVSAVAGQVLHLEDGRLR